MSNAWRVFFGLGSVGPRHGSLKIRYRFDAPDPGPRLIVEVPNLVQAPGPVIWHHLKRPVDHYGFMYLLIDIADGSIRQHAQRDQLDLDEVPDVLKDAPVIGHTFLLGAIEMVDFHQHEGLQKENSLNPVWNIASIMQTGERVLFLHSSLLRDHVLRYTTELRQLLTSIQAAQRPRLQDHIRLMREGTGREELAQHYKDTFKPPQLMF